MRRRGSRPYRWNAVAGRYVDPRTGRFIAERDVRAAIDKALARADTRVTVLAEQLRAREIDARRWAREMRSAIKDRHLYAAAAAKGGWRQMDAADFGRVGQAVRVQFGYLHRFAKEIEAGLPLDGRFLRRVRLYAQAARRTFHLVERDEMLDRGFDLEENILGPADHCSGCVGETARGPVPIGTMIPIGDRECLANCRCRVRYLKRADRAA